MLQKSHTLKGTNMNVKYMCATDKSCDKSSPLANRLGQVPQYHPF